MQVPIKKNAIELDMKAVCLSVCVTLFVPYLALSSVKRIECLKGLVHKLKRC
jgi:NO-binding membrane sensor protein with MHYT domain